MATTSTTSTSKIAMGFKISSKPTTAILKSSFIGEQKSEYRRENKKQLLNGIINETSILDNINCSNNLIIPLIQKNNWRIENKDNNINKDDINKDNNDLNIHNQAINELIYGRKDIESKINDQTVIPLLLQNAIPGLENIKSETERINKDVDIRPDEASLDDYERIPVENFGAAMLRGMGWSDENPEVGKTNKAVTKPFEGTPRDGRAGLGADKGPNLKNYRPDKRIIAPGEERKKPLDISDLNPFEMKIGALVEIIAGSHNYSFGRVISFDTKKVVVCLHINEDNVTVYRDDIDVLAEKKLASSHPAFSKGAQAETYRKSKLAEFKSTSKSSSFQDKSNKRSSSEISSSHDDTNKTFKKKESKITWVSAGVYVRIINEKLKNGEIYNKKGYVEDITSPYTFSVLLESKRLIENLTENDVETAIPKIGGKVKFVRGGNSGDIGILMEKDSDKNKGVVQIQRLAEIVTCSLDDIAGFL